jgi:hypothetical protein
MLIVFVVSIAVALLATPALGASQQNWTQCSDTSRDPGRNIAACTQILNRIESPQTNWTRS